MSTKADGRRKPTEVQRALRELDRQAGRGPSSDVTLERIVEVIRADRDAAH